MQWHLRKSHPGTGIVLKTQIDGRDARDRRENIKTQ
jgi:hypothetical protein